MDEFESYYWNIDDLDSADANDARVLDDLMRHEIAGVRGMPWASK
jgi:hypothetical protein